MRMFVSLVAAILFFTGCGIVDKITRPKDGEGLLCSYDIDGCSQSLNPNSYAYVTLRNDRDHEVTISPSGALKKIHLDDSSFDEVPPVKYTVTATTRSRYRQTKKKRKAVESEGTTRFFETRVILYGDLKTTVSVKFEVGVAYEVSVANGKHDNPKITIRKIDPSRLNFTAAQWGWLAYRRPHPSRDENTYDVVPTTLICSPCGDD